MEPQAEDELEDMPHAHIYWKVHASGLESYAKDNIMRRMLQLSAELDPSGTMPSTRNYTPTRQATRGRH